MDFWDSVPEEIASVVTMRQSKTQVVFGTWGVETTLFLSVRESFRYDVPQLPSVSVFKIHFSMKNYVLSLKARAFCVILIRQHVLSNFSKFEYLLYFQVREPST